MILKDQKIFFHHVPKTGGKTISDFLARYYNLPYRSLLHFDQGCYVSTKLSDKTVSTVYNICHLPYLELLRLTQEANIIIDNSWDIFTIVRNPYHRITSAIFFQSILECKWHIHALPTLPEKRKLFEKSYNLFLNSDPIGNDWFSHRLPQHLLLETDPNKPIYKLYKYEDGLENILKDVLGYRIKEDINLGNIHSMEFEDNYPKPNYSDLFTRDYIEKINEYYYKDFEFCGYEMWNPLDFPKN